MTEQKKRLLKAKIAVALQNELGRVPTEDEINNVFLMARVMLGKVQKEPILLGNVDVGGCVRFLHKVR